MSQGNFVGTGSYLGNAIFVYLLNVSVCPHFFIYAAEWKCDQELHNESIRQ